MTEPRSAPDRRTSAPARVRPPKSGKPRKREASAAPGMNDDLIEVRLRLPRSVVEHVVATAATPAREVQRDRVALANLILRGRRQRSALFVGVRFGEPSWDMILDLYVTTHRGERIDVSNLCLASGVAMTTAFRHVGMMVRRGYLVREDDAHDKRRKFVAMSPRLEDAVNHWLDREAGALALNP